MNYRLIATRIGNDIKYSTTLNEIDRHASAVFRFERDSFPHPAITSQRAQRVYDWIMTLGRQRMDPEQRTKLVVQFCRGLVGDNERRAVDGALADGGVALHLLNQDNLTQFTARDFHPLLHQHCRALFVQGNYFHAVFEAVKAYHQAVQLKAQSTKDGQALMHEVWSPDKGVLKITKCETQTDRNVQSGIGSLAAGLMAAIRNPTAHEPALDWPISRQDALDLLSFVSFLLRQLDRATYFTV